MASPTELIRAIDLLLSGESAEAHAIVQKHESDADACHIHAVLHHLEGDEENARYWYGRAGRHESADPKLELQRLRERLLNPDEDG